MGIKRIIDRNFWTDEKVLDMFSPEDRLFMLYLLTCPDSTQVGIFKLNPRVAAFHLGYSPETIKVLLDRFESKYGIIKRAPKTNEIAIKNYLCYSIVKGGKPVFDLLVKELDSVQDTALIRYVFDNLKSKRDLNLTVKQVLEQYVVPFKENGNEKENDNDNDNDNEESSTNRITNRPTIRYETTTAAPVAPNPFVLWNSNICPMTAILSEKLQSLVEEVGELPVCQAIESAVLNGVRNFNYVQAAARGIARGETKQSKPSNSPRKEKNDVEGAYNEMMAAFGGESNG